MSWSACCITWTGRFTGAVPSRLWNGCRSFRRGTGRSRHTQAACGAVSTWPPASSAVHRSFFSTSRRLDLTPERVTSSGSSFEELVADGTTVLLTTQYMEEAEHLASSIVVLDAGRVVASGTADELKDRMGGNVLEIHVAHQADLEKAASLVADLGTAAPRLDSEQNKLSMPVKGGPRELIAAGRALDDVGMALEDLGIRRPSLDDVFLALTGHATGPVNGSGTRTGEADG